MNKDWWKQFFGIQIAFYLFLFLTLSLGGCASTPYGDYPKQPRCAVVEDGVWKQVDCEKAFKTP